MLFLLLSVILKYFILRDKKAENDGKGMTASSVVKNNFLKRISSLIIDVPSLIYPWFLVFQLSLLLSRKPDFCRHDSLKIYFFLILSNVTFRNQNCFIKKRGYLSV